MHTPPPITDAEFGNWGGIAVVNPRKHILRTIVERGAIVDPYSIQVLGDGKLLIADFSSFGNSGQVYTVDPGTGAVKIMAASSNLIDPTSAFMDDDNVLWIANGDQDNQDGEILELDLVSQQQRVVFPKQGAMSGALLGVAKAHDDGYVIGTKNDWDQRTKSKVMLIEKKSGAAKPLLSGSEDVPQFFST